MSKAADLIVEAADWVQENRCPLPVDLFVALNIQGIDAEELQADLLDRAERGDFDTEEN